MQQELWDLAAAVGAAWGKKMQVLYVQTLKNLFYMDSVPSKEHCWLKLSHFLGILQENHETLLPISLARGCLPAYRAWPLCLSWGGVWESRFRLLSGAHQRLLSFVSSLVSQKAFPCLRLHRR